jgi:hypothetical protein
MRKPTKSDSNHNSTTPTTTPKSSARKTQREDTSTEKSKSRFAVAKPPKSPALPSPAHNRVDTTNASSVCSSQASSISNRPELALYIQKQLATDIEEAGGINAVIISTGNNQALSQLCNRNQKVYGKRGDLIRRRIHRKVLYWKKYVTEGTYREKVLDRLRHLPGKGS